MSRQTGPVFYCRCCNAVLQAGDNWRLKSEERSDYTCIPCHALHSQARCRTPETRYKTLVLVARPLGGTDITYEQYQGLISQACRYCGFSLNPCGHALDKKDPKAGYKLANVVPCCKLCNLAKSDHLTYEEMLIVGASIRQVRLARG